MWNNRVVIWSLEWCCQHRDDSGTLLAHKISATQKSQLFKYLKTTFSPDVRRLHAHHLRSKTRSLVSDFDSSTCQLRKMLFSKFRPGWWQFCWMTGVKFNSIHSILVRFLHITQFTVCAAKNLTVFVADSPRCLEWSSMVAAVPCVSCQSPASAGLGSPGDRPSHPGHIGNTRRRRLITCCQLWPAARRFWLGLHLMVASLNAS